MRNRDINEIKKENSTLKKELEKIYKEFYLYRKNAEDEIRTLKDKNEFRVGIEFPKSTFFDGMPYTYYLDILNIGYQFDNSKLIDGKNVVILKKIEKEGVKDER